MGSGRLEMKWIVLGMCYVNSNLKEELGPKDSLQAPIRIVFFSLRLNEITSEGM